MREALPALPHLPPAHCGRNERSGRSSRRFDPSTMPDATITVTVNGTARTVRGHPSVRELLGLLDLDPRQVVVEVNREIVRRPALDTVALADGDRVEVVHFVGGG